MLGEDTLFERQLKDFQEIEDDPNKNVDEAKLNEGEFSWHAGDTDEPIYSTKGHQVTIYMLDDKGNKYQEDAYEGYGVFGGKDFYILLGEMNGLELSGAQTSDDEKFYDDRGTAIDFASRDGVMDDNEGVRYPRFTTDPSISYARLPNPRSHANQGWFEEEGRDEHDFDDEAFDESKTDEQEEVEEARTKKDIEQKIKDIKDKMMALDNQAEDFDDRVEKYDREVEELEAALKDLEEKCKKVKEGEEEAKEQDESKVNEATVGCPNCGGELDVVEDDVRDEWERIDYYCPKCKRDFSRKIEFDQAGMTTSDEWDDEEGTPVDETKTDEQEEVNEVFKTEEDVAKFVEKNAKVTGKYDERVSVNYGDKSYQSEDTHDLVVQICKDKNIACESKTNEEEIGEGNKVDTVSNDPSFERAVEEFARVESDENKNVAEDVQVEEDLYDEPEFPAGVEKQEAAEQDHEVALDDLVSDIKAYVGGDVDEQSIRNVVWAFSMDSGLVDKVSIVAELFKKSREEEPEEEVEEPVESKEDD